jgi:hypothetical protein
MNGYPITHGGMDRVGKLCQCHACGHEAICGYEAGVGPNFYAAPENNLLVCEKCFLSSISVRRRSKKPGMVTTLLHAVTPPSLYAAKPADKPHHNANPTQKQIDSWKENAKAANEVKKQKTIARYKAVMGARWVKQQQIEKSLNLASCSASPLLNRWLAEGLTEMRQADGRTKEWRFVE